MTTDTIINANLRFRDKALSTPNIWGAEGLVGAEQGGYHTRSDAQVPVLGTDRTVDGQPLGELWTELNTRTALFNQHAQALTSLLTTRTRRAQEKVSVYSTARFEEATEFDRPSKIRAALISRGFPIRHYDLGYGFTQEFIDSARSTQITAIQNKAEAAFWHLEMDVAMTALFTNANATDEDGISVKRLYNGDGEIPPEYKRYTHVGAHSHYLTSGNAAFTFANVETMEEHLLHHGYGDNGETLVLLANREDLKVLRALVEWIPAETARQAVVLDGAVVGQLPSAPNGLTAQGYLGEFVVVQEDMLPAGYLLGFATGGTFADENPVAIRLHENEAISGMRLVEGPNGRYPLKDATYDTYLGAGVRHRGGAVVMQETAGGYTVPTF